MDGYDIPRAARVLGVDPRALREAIESGLVPAVRESGRWLIPSERLEEARAHVPPSFPSRPGPGGDEALGELHARLDRIEGRVAALEAGSGRPAGRPALAPLFHPRD